jgi:3-oxoacyl-[acyl-carrier protein] reductase
MDLNLKGKVAIVGGASQGIGLGIATRLALEGARVVITARREPSLSNAAEQIRKETGADVLSVAADVRKADDASRVVEQTLRKFGAIHALVNNDGAPPIGKALGFDDTAWEKAVEQNLMSVVRMVRLAVPHIKSAGGGAIVNITALSAIQPMVGFGLSVATWAGVIGLAKTLSLELARDAIRVNTICPGLINTTRLDKVFRKQAEDEGRGADAFMDELKRDIPLGRFGTVEDIAGYVALLLSPFGSFITGTTLQIDGGARRALL